MPRRRATKINVRATPTVSHNTDIDKLSEEDRMKKIDVFLSDFDEKVASQLKSMEEEKKCMLLIVTRRIHLQIIQVPRNMRNITLREFIAAGGTLEAVSDKQDSVDDTKESAVFKSRKYCETIPEEKSDFKAPKATTGRRKKYGTRTNALKRQDPPSTIKSNFKTPLTRNAAAAGWDTPIITPKFDPRLPFQSHKSRDPKPGERLVSLQGSPVAVSTKKGPPISIKGNHLTLDVDLTENLTMDDIDVDFGEGYIEKVMKIFSQISSKLAVKR